MADKQCPRCKLWNSESAQRCDCGYDFASDQVKPSYIGARGLSELDYITLDSDSTKMLAPNRWRSVNLAIDTALYYVLSWLVSWFITSRIVAPPDPERVNELIITYIASTVMNIIFPYFSYYFIFEVLFQRTPGKFITKTKVVMLDGSKPKIRNIAIRTLVRFIPFLVLSGNRGTFWHDRWSKTRVIKGWK